MVLVFQANPRFTPSDQKIIQTLFKDVEHIQDGFKGFRQDLAVLTRSFGGPVLMIHGDTHSFRVDQPLRDENGILVDEAHRLEVFGSPFADAWVRIDVTANESQIFTISPMRGASLPY